MAVSPAAGLQGKGLAKGIQSGLSLGLLNETDTGVNNQQGKNNTEIEPILDDGRDNTGDLDEVGDGTGEVAHELEERVALDLSELVGAEASETLSGLGGGKTVLGIGLEESFELRGDLISVLVVLGFLDLEVTLLLGFCEMEKNAQMITIRKQVLFLNNNNKRGLAGLGSVGG
jgi:hypothetical protein